MNIKESFTCKYCNNIYKDPITLTCCGDNLCKQHIEELTSNNSPNGFPCPLCNEQNTNQNLRVSKLIQDLLEIEAHKFQIDFKYETVLNSFRAEITNLEAAINDPENEIYEQINELKRQVDMDREKIKIQVDNLADNLIKQLESYENQFKSKWQTNNNDMNEYRCLAKAARNKFNEYEKFIHLLSSRTEEKDRQSEESQLVIRNLKLKSKEFKDLLFSNLEIKYHAMRINLSEMFGKLKIKDLKSKQIQGKIKTQLKGHNGYIHSLLLLPNGDLVSGSGDATIKIWDINDGTVKQTLAGHSDWINDLIFLDDNRLISASEDNTIKIWNFTNARDKITLTGHRKRVLALKLTKNGDLASASSDKTIKIWNKNDGTLINTLVGHTGEVRALALLSNGDLVSGSSDKTIKIWDVDSGTVLKTLTGHAHCVFGLKLLDGGDLVSWDTSIKIWNMEDGTVKQTLEGHVSNVLALTVLGSGDLVSGAEDGEIKIWDAESGKVKKNIQLSSPVYSLEVLHNGDLVSASVNSIIIWE